MMPLVVLSTKKVSCDPQVGGGELFFGPSISTQADSLCCPKMLLDVAFQLCHQGTQVFAYQCSAWHFVPRVQGSNQ